MVETGDRRPIASRERVVWQRTARYLATTRVTGNAISVLGMGAGVAAGVMLFLTGWVENVWAVRGLFVGAAVGIQLRLIGNMLDGMVAIAGKQVSRVGELYNELPDRVSDTAIFLGAGYALGGHAVLGWAAAGMAVFVTYVRALGKGMGVPGLFQGPMSKSHRMATMTVACGAAAIVPSGWETWAVPGISGRVGMMGVALGLVVVGGSVTVWRRVGRIVAAMKGGA